MGAYWNVRKDILKSVIHNDTRNIEGLQAADRRGIHGKQNIYSITLAKQQSGETVGRTQIGESHFSNSSRVRMNFPEETPSSVVHTQKKKKKKRAWIHQSGITEKSDLGQQELLDLPPLPMYQPTVCSQNKGLGMFFLSVARHGQGQNYHGYLGQRAKQGGARGNSRLWPRLWRVKDAKLKSGALFSKENCISKDRQRPQVRGRCLQKSSSIFLHLSLCI